MPKAPKSRGRPCLWGDDVKQFKPERFVNGVASATKGLSFLPFSSGPRTCIGQNFSMLQAKLFVAKVLQRFSVELSPSYTHAPFPAATTFPQHGAHLIIRKANLYCSSESEVHAV